MTIGPKDRTIALEPPQTVHTWPRALLPANTSLLHIIVKIIVISIFFSSFNNVDLLCSMLVDCCMPPRQEWGTMAAVGGQQPPWLACVCISPSFS
jgi:hypothetical protein